MRMESAYGEEEWRVSKWTGRLHLEGWDPVCLSWNNCYISSENCLNAYM